MKYYHLSYNDLGKQHEFVPRVPLSRSMEEESQTPRTCVAPSIKLCLYAITGHGLWADVIRNMPYILQCNQMQPFVVYEFSHRNLSLPQDVSDSYRTGEMWFCRPKIGRRLGWLVLEDLLFHDTVSIKPQAHVQRPLDLEKWSLAIDHHEKCSLSSSTELLNLKITS